VLKLRIAFCLALVVGILTLANGIVYGARAITILYRVVISVVVFGFAGYFLGFVIENFLKQLLIRNTAQGQHIDVVSEQQTTDELPTESAFKPFVSENFEQISRPK
jgi:thiamine transporter ThiT